MASGVWEQALEDAAKELDAPATDFKVEKLATLTLLLKVQRSQWAQGKFTATNEMLAVMGEIERMRREHGKDGIQEINVHIVPSAAIACPSCSHEFNPHNGEPVTPKPLVLRTQCPYCHRASEICTDGPFPEGNPGKPIPQPPALAAQAAPAPAEPSLTVKGYREGVSASAIRASVLANNEVPPVKKLQPSYYDMPRRTVSPMSDPGIGIDPKPRREYAPGESAFDELNPNRKVNQGRSEMSQDSNRISDLNSKLTAYGGKTPTDLQQSLDFAHIARIAKDEVKDKHGT